MLTNTVFFHVMSIIHNGQKMQPVIVLAVMLALSFFGKTALCAQTHVSVPVGHAVYYILDQAETRGLCPPLPAVKPYTRGKILELVNEILAAEPKRFGGLTDSERSILENFRAEFTDGRAGLRLRKGLYRFDSEGKDSVRLAGDVGVNMESLNSAARYTEKGTTYSGTDTWGTFFIRGDVGDHFSYDVDFSAGMMKAQRVFVGTYDLYATELEKKDPNDPNKEYINRRVETYSQPLAFFPYTYQKKWDGFMFNLGAIEAGNMEGWPNDTSIAAGMMSEMSGSMFGDTLLIRFGRIRREWGAMTPGNSLVLNSAARPFTGIEANFSPVSWFAFSSVTGVLEFDNVGGIKEPAETFQNAYSLYQVELNAKNYFHLDFGSAAVWPKRFELGYIFPLLDNFFYQNYVGDFDNTAIFLNIKGQYPGLGKVWFSFFLDELEIGSMKRSFELDRHMFAYQTGVQGIVPFLSFTSVTLGYTKIEPYNYTHTRTYLPWYGNNLMETAFVNGGAGLGYYLPPNSDEIKVRFDMRPLSRTATHIQYQLIRHGADYGRHQVDGSSLVSELDPKGRSDKASLQKNFLHDGAYQWMHVVRIGADHSLKRLPFSFFGEAGVAYSYFTDISNEEYARYAPTPDGQDPRSPALGDYLKSTAFIFTVGFRMFK
jgi:hypothetical protein